MSTPNGTTITANTPTGQQDVTLAVQCLYDLFISSMDFGSGFISVEDALPVGELAKLCGFDEDDRVTEYIVNHRLEEELQKLRLSNMEKGTWQNYDEIRAQAVENLTAQGLI